VSSILLMFMFASSAPSPLYKLYAAQWHFSALLITVVFAVAPLALLAVLLVAGSSSDAIGRRPVLMASLALEAAAMVVFLFAVNLGWLLVARAVQGAATGLATGSTAATIIDLQPAHRPNRAALINTVAPSVGLFCGALAAGALVQYAPQPRRLVYVFMLAVFLAQLVALVQVSEPVTERGRLELRVRIGVERAARAPFIAAIPALIAVLAELIDRSDNRLVGAAAVAILTGCAALCSLAVRAWPARRSMLAGCAALAAGSLLTVASIPANSLVLFCAATAVAGAGFGAAFLGTFRTLGVVASLAARAGLVSAIYVVAYLAFSLPAVIAGVLTIHLGLRHTAIGYGLVVAILAISAIPATARADHTDAAPGAAASPSAQ
jgi:predicted MFS family arabinose efflux permease